MKIIGYVIFIIYFVPNHLIEVAILVLTMPYVICLALLIK